VRFRLSEPAYVQVRVQGRPVTSFALRRAGVDGIPFSRPGKRARTVELRVLDLAGNATRARLVLRR
jgi:hypothetical protein